MSNILNDEISKIISIAAQHGEKIAEEKAFDILICSLYCYNSLDYEKNWFDIYNENITDEKSDGGIDFVYFDEENSKVIFGQNKYSQNIDVNEAVAELRKLDATVKDFQNNSTSKLSKEVKKRILNALDRLTEENEGNFDYVFASLSTFKTENVISKVESDSQYADLYFYNLKTIEKTIIDLKSKLKVVREYKFNLDRSKNALEYSSDRSEGIVVNISAGSLKKAFDQYESEGLFNLNIRRYIKSKNVDEAIRSTITKDSENFWFKNNGLTIACKDYILDGNSIKIYDFSIVNGGQTSTLIAKDYKSNKEDFYVMCKIVKSSEELDEDATMRFYNEIAEATNSQKPIQPRDLKSNAPEMLKLQQLLEGKDYFLEIKRGVYAPRKYGDNKIKNEELAQLYFSFVLQKPGTARSNKRSLFSNNAHYKQVFLQKFEKQPEKIEFLVDLIQLSKRIDKVILRYKAEDYKKLNNDQMNVLANSKQTLMGLLGFIYSLVNKDSDLSQVRDITQYFEFGSFISNYKEDDIDEKISQLIYELIDWLTEIYINEFEFGRVTSVSNFLKTDKKYSEAILEKYANHLNKRKNKEELIDYYGSLFRR
ncbi:hypothetical protein DDV21_000365 [Streptococcus chenjunshii]|uniref:Abortive phage infection protein C-terminal domain-containing protein n=1 Tax=Streptococcus chenjunshii TaxID=2173853 RepID=A0A372KLE7_9STRE|nr:AIPR family protein [Streptococcus chenjunshii]AXQ77650.1 hypothetical protein DDV21_000365 [Streptococcus chenjunshii]RFU50633.1 hypothetical protein DDV22_07460 [Streptococcus chenjunshii]RFU52806.1 hypothetical protein DDV23_07565 [Streptococcus chenjunshii]